MGMLWIFTYNHRFTVHAHIRTCSLLSISWLPFLFYEAKSTSTLTDCVHLYYIESQSLQCKKGHSRSSAETEVKSQPNHANHENAKSQSQEIYKNLRDILSVSLCSNRQSILPQLEAAEMFGNCIIDFQI